MSMQPKVWVSCYTGTIKTSPHTFTYVQGQFEIEPTGYFRTPCGRGKAANRFHYTMLFIAPAGVIDPNSNQLEGKETRANIFRRANPSWMPPKDGWVGNVWRPEQVKP